jgi:hypothetical protein
MRYVVYESMFGNTHNIATAVAAGLGAPDDVTIRAVTDIAPGALVDAELVVVGGPTHVHGMSRPKTRDAAREMAAKPDSGLAMDDKSSGIGVREWVAAIKYLPVDVAAFDTRVDAPAAFTGRASKSIAKLLRRTGARIVVPAESFLVTKQNELVAGELERARAWGAYLAALLDRPRAEVGSE